MEQQKEDEISIEELVEKEVWSDVKKMTDCFLFSESCSEL